MPRFPQLLSGALTQLPFTARLESRTVVNETQDGRQVKGADAGLARATWEVSLAALTDGELAAIQALATECEGRLRTFLFADPLDNLLRHSENYAESVWTRGPGLSVTAGAADPWGTQRASSLSNSGAAAAGLAQTLPLPGVMTHCVSAWVKGGSVTLHSESGGITRTKTFTVGNAWERVEMMAAHDTTADETTVALLLPPSGAAQVAGIQLEAQPAASSYKRTAGAAGLYPNARFADDTFLATSTDVNQHSITVRITAPWER